MQLSNTVVRLISAVLPYEHESTHVPLGTLMIASALQKAGIELDCVDLQTSCADGEDVVGVLRDFIVSGPAIVGISVMCDGLPFVLQACNAARALRPEMKIVLGGPGVSFASEELLRMFSSIDVVVSGEGDALAGELFGAIASDQMGLLTSMPGTAVRDASTGCVSMRPPSRRTAPSDLHPAFECINPESYETLGLLSSIGCPYYCRFCSTAPLWGRHVREREIDSILWEMERGLEMGFGRQKRYLMFSDDLFTRNLERTKTVCKAIAQRNFGLDWACLARVGDIREELMESMAEAGCRAIAVGIESGSQRVLDEARKGTRVSEVLTAIATACRYVKGLKLFFMWGFPFETASDVMLTANLVRRIRQVVPDEVELNLVLKLVAPLPGSDLMNQYKDSIRLDFDLLKTFGGFGQVRSLLDGPSGEEVRELVESVPEIFGGYTYFDQPELAQKCRIIERCLEKV